jgi:hypothetical protein
MSVVAPAKGKQSAGVSGSVPFVHAAHEHIEAVRIAAFNGLVTANQQFVNLNIPSFGFLRHLVLIVSTSGGTAGTGVLSGDGPYNLFSEVTLLDTNGAPIYGPLDGYSAFCSNKYGGYAYNADPAAQPDAAVASSNIINFAFILRVPVEINHNSGFGSLGNMNSAASYKLRLGINTLANLYSTVGTLVSPTVNVDVYMECWTPPDAYDAFGRPQETEPPSHGTSQSWSKQTVSLTANANQILLTRMGNLIRNVIFVVRDTTGVRRTVANVPTTLTLQWDSRQMFVEDVKIRRAYMAERYQQVAGATGVESGVLPYSYMHDVLGHGGDGGVALFLPTVQATRFELDVTNAQTGSVDILTNDVLPVEADPRRRYVETSTSGFHPEIGTQNPRMP